MYEIEELDLRLDPEPTRPEIRAYASFVYGGLCVRHVKVIREGCGRMQVRFPDYPVKEPCVRCARRVPITVRFCCHCGMRQPYRIAQPSPKTGAPHRYNSVVFPVGAAARAWFEAAILHAFVEATNARAKAS